MTIPRRRRGAQPGNQNACKHGLYRQKPAPGQRPRGGQPGNLNALLHGRFSALLSPAPSPRVLLRYRSDLPPAAPPLQPQPPGWLDRLLSRFEAEQLAPLDDPACTYAELIRRLHNLNEYLARYLDQLSQRYPSDPPHPERKLP